MKPQIIIKSAYKYYDEIMKVWNLFIFVEFCSVSFCVQRIRKDIDRFIDYGKKKIYDSESIKSHMFIYEIDKIYIFENINILSKSMYELKKKFNGKLKKIKLSSLKNKTIINTLQCLSCYSCNFFIYLLRCAYIDNPQNIIINGIYADYKKVFWNSDDIESLSNALNYWKKYIIYNQADLADKISQFINLKYNNKIFYSNDEFTDYNTNCCDINGCDFTCLKNDVNLFFCQECFSYKQNSQDLNFQYNLCVYHCTEPEIKKHIFSEHKDTNICKFVNWNDELEKIEEETRIKKFNKLVE